MNLKFFNDLKRRFVVSSVILTVVSLLLANYTFLPFTIALVLFIGALVAVGVWEYSKLAVAKKLRPAYKTMMIVAVAEVFAFFAAHKGLVIAEFPALVLVLAAIVFFVAHFKDTEDALACIAVEFFGVCYVSVPLSCLLGILYPLDRQEVLQDGRWWLIYLVSVTKITDVAAYFVGKIFGRVKLAPVLSPKKTMEGALAGFAAAVATSICFSIFCRSFGVATFSLPLFEAVCLGSFIGVLSQVGDLAESLLKRDAFVKDSNNLPGVGGVLDMVDSLLLTAPTVYFYLKIF